MKFFLSGAVPNGPCRQKSYMWYDQRPPHNISLESRMLGTEFGGNRPETVEDMLVFRFKILGIPRAEGRQLLACCFTDTVVVMSRMLHVNYEANWQKNIAVTGKWNFFCQVLSRMGHAGKNHTCDMISDHPTTFPLSQGCLVLNLVAIGPKLWKICLFSDFVNVVIHAKTQQVSGSLTSPWPDPKCDDACHQLWCRSKRNCGFV